MRRRSKFGLSEFLLDYVGCPIVYRTDVFRTRSTEKENNTSGPLYRSSWSSAVSITVESITKYSVWAFLETSFVKSVHHNDHEFLWLICIIELHSSIYAKSRDDRRDFASGITNLCTARYVSDVYLFHHGASKHVITRYYRKVCSRCTTQFLASVDKLSHAQEFVYTLRSHSKASIVVTWCTSLRVACNLAISSLRISLLYLFWLHPTDPNSLLHSNIPLNIGSSHKNFPWKA